MTDLSCNGPHSKLLQRIVDANERHLWIKTASCALTSFLRDRLQTGSDDVVVLLQLVAQSVPPPQLADQFGRLQCSAILDLLDDGTQLFRG